MTAAKKQGFSLFETVIVIGIAAIISGVAFLNFFGVRANKELRLKADELVGYLRNAQQRSISQDQSSQWGVHLDASAVDSDFYVIFYGVDYAGGVKISTISLGPAVQFSDPAQGTSKDVIFSKVSGLPDSQKSITLIHGGNPSACRNVTINTSGLIMPSSC